MKTLKNREIAHKFNTEPEVRTVKGVEKSGEVAVFMGLRQLVLETRPKQERSRGRQILL